MFLLVFLTVFTVVHGQKMDLPPFKSCYAECEQLWCPQDSCQTPLWCETQVCQPTTITATTTVIPSTSVLTSTMTLTTTDSTTKTLTNFINQTITKYRPNILTQMSYLTQTQTVQETITVTEYLNKVKRNASDNILSTMISNSSRSTDIHPSGTKSMEDDFEVSSGDYAGYDNDQYYVEDNVNNHQTDINEKLMTEKMLRMAQNMNLFLNETTEMLELYHNASNSPKQETNTWFKQPFQLIETHPQLAGKCLKSSPLGTKFNLHLSHHLKIYYSNDFHYPQDV